MREAGAWRERPPPKQNPGARMPGLASDLLPKTGDEDATPRNAARQAADVAWDAPSWKDAARAYQANRPPKPDPDDPRIARARRLLADDVSFERAWHRLNRHDRAASSTVDALMFSVRRGLSALAEPAAQRRLSELSEEQVCEVYARVQRFKPHIAPAWSEADGDALLGLWRDLGQDA